MAQKHKQKHKQQSSPLGEPLTTSSSFEEEDQHPERTPRPPPSKSNTDFGSETEFEAHPIRALYFTIFDNLNKHFDLSIYSQ